MADWNDQYSSFDWEESYNSELDVSLDEGGKHHVHTKKITLSVNASKINSNYPTDQSGPLVQADRLDQPIGSSHGHASDHTLQTSKHTHKRRQHREGQNEHNMHNYSIKERQENGTFVSRDRHESHSSRKGRKSFYDTMESPIRQTNRHAKQNKSTFNEQKQHLDDIMSSSIILTRNRQVFSRQGQELYQTPSLKDIRVQDGKTVNIPATYIHGSFPSDAQVAPRSSSELPRPHIDTDMLDQGADIIMDIPCTLPSVSVKPCLNEEPTPVSVIDTNLDIIGTVSPTEALTSTTPKEPSVAGAKAIVIRQKGLDHKSEPKGTNFKSSGHLNAIDSHNISISSITTDDHDRGSPVRQQPGRGSITSSRISVVFADGTSLQRDDSYDKKSDAKPYKDIHKEPIKLPKSKDTVTMVLPKADVNVKSQPSVETGKGSRDAPGKPTRSSNKSKQSPNSENPKFAAAKISIKIDAKSYSLEKSNSKTDSQEGLSPKSHASTKGVKQIIVVLPNEEPIYSDFRSASIKLPSSVWRIP
ncbi:Hypothetical protein GLP15_2542 [Giardia lamblia P15]|uniref:Uncharacterized protein n=1 Tax=Giardia intestinalis (strain P15) TaxID=658858 RepID=E1EXD8_GIAIA|nr:Hypothetical protein GLP15_2542 [Giardia lamblia P15]